MGGSGTLLVKVTLMKKERPHGTGFMSVCMGCLWFSILGPFFGMWRRLSAIVKRRRLRLVITARFLDPIQAEKLDGTWKLLAPLRYQSAVLRAMIVVPAGFVTDFASSPRLPLVYLLTGNTAHAAAVVHDYLYSLHLPGIDRSLADSLLYEAMVVSGEYRWRAWMMWSAVRMFGGAAWASGPERLQIRGGPDEGPKAGASSPGLPS